MHFFFFKDQSQALHLTKYSAHSSQGFVGLSSIEQAVEPKSFTSQRAVQAKPADENTQASKLVSRCHCIISPWSNRESAQLENIDHL